MKSNTRRIAAAAAVTLACTMLLAAFTPAGALFGKSREAAAISAFAKSDAAGELITFTEKDFTAQVSGDETLSAIVISRLPETGVLRLAGRPLQQGEAIETETLSTLCYVPQIGEETHTSFEFLPVFSRSGASEEGVTVSLNVSDQPNSAPIAMNLSAETYADIKLCGHLRCTDPDGDACKFVLLSQPKYGQVSVTETGFTYVPGGKSGKVTFTYAATDCYGNRSKPATVTVNVIRRSAKEAFSYTDMTDSIAHFAALRLRESGVFCGETLGNEAFLYPDRPVTRAEFLTMTAAIRDLALPSASVSTGLSDNEQIPVWAQSYVVAAMNEGIVVGESNGLGNRVFRADDSITRAEAAAILNRALGLVDDGRTMTFADAAQVPMWAAQSVTNTAAVGILPVFGDNTIRCGEAVTREDAVVMLYQMLQASSGDGVSNTVLSVF